MTFLFHELEAWIPALALSGLMLAAWRFGIWRGRRKSRGAGDPASGKFEEAAMTLVGLLVAFTFAMSLQKHDHRREMLVSDSNAIGDFYTCASLLKEPVRSRLQNVIREYAQLRLATARGKDVKLDEALTRFDQLHVRMTDLVAEALNDGTPIAVPLTNTLNGVTSNQAARLAAIRDRLAGIIVFLLFLSAAISTALIGRQQGESGKPRVAGLLSYVVLVSLVVYVILDLNQPRHGLITVSQEPMERLVRSMGK